MLNVIFVTSPGDGTVCCILVIYLFAACQVSLLASIDRCGGVHVSCGEQLLLGICWDVFLDSFTHVTIEVVFSFLLFSSIV
jgi:hypothetical protein